MSSAKHEYSEIPNNFPLKRYFPLNKTMWQIFKQYGWDHIITGFDKGMDFFGYEVFKHRLNAAIETAREVLEGTLQNPEKTIAFTLYPPGGYIRSDLQQGTMKLLYGESIDVSYVGIRDDTLETAYILNGHIEDGIPVDWWMIGPDSEILDRRHHKHGIKLRDIPKKFNGLEKSGWAIRDVLMDIRNERTPQWNHSTYQVGVGYSSMIHIVFDMSNYECLGRIYDMFAAKRKYKMPDIGFVYLPMPQMIHMISYLDRPFFLLRLNGLNMEHKFFTSRIEQFAQDFLKQEVPEDWSLLVDKKWTEDGIPWPIQTLGCELPKYQNDKLYGKSDFNWKYPQGKFLTLDDLRMSLDEALQGIFYKIDHTTEVGSIDMKESIISRGVGSETVFQN